MTKSGGQSVSRSMNRTMTRRGCAVLLAVFAFTPCAVGQEIKTEVVSAFVWGEDSRSGAMSSTIEDPLTGHSIHKLRYGPIEMSSRIGFERVSAYEVGTYLNYTTTIVNGSDSTLSVRYGGNRIDGRAGSPPSGYFFGEKTQQRGSKKK